jgi:hypothetical protein
MGVPTIEIPVWKWNALKKSEADLGFVLSVLEHVLVASEDGGDMDDIDWDLLRSTVATVKAKAGE